MDKNHRKFFNKAAAKPFFCLAPVFKYKWFFKDLFKGLSFGGGKKRDDEKSKDYCKADTT